MDTISELGFRISLIDGFDLNREHRTGTYVIHDTPLTIVETSASPSIPHLLKGLAELNIDPADIAYIILTHIHLDHAGGTGLFLSHCPNAKVIVHPKGARHLEDPSRLIAGAKAVYGNKFDELFNPILPIPKDRLIIKHNQDTLQFTDQASLTFYDTPGHANHHLSIFDSTSKGMFSGDTIGVYYRDLDEAGIEWYMPSTSPNQFNPTAMLAAIDLYRSIGVERIYFGHYGVSDNPEEVYHQIQTWLPIYIEAAESAFHACSSFDEQVSMTQKTLYDKTHDLLAKQGIPADHPVFEIIALDLEVCSMGLVDYLMRKQKEEKISKSL
ncbi:MBL fold metallo-hydrolase [Bacillus sp. JJ634]